MSEQMKELLAKIIKCPLHLGIYYSRVILLALHWMREFITLVQLAEREMNALFVSAAHIQKPANCT